MAAAVDIAGIVAMQIEEVAIAVNKAVNDAMAADILEEPLEGIGTIGTTRDMAGIEGVVALAPAADILVIATTTATTSTTSGHTVFKARWLSIF